MSEHGCSFTGHRRIEISHRAGLGGILARAIAYAYGEGCRTFYCGGALGFDTAAAREVIRFRLAHPDVRLCLILPCQDQDARWSSAAREAYAYILSSADEVIYVSEHYTEGCMKLRNRALAESCDILIAYCGRYGSGAAQTVRMAEGLGKRVYNLWPALESEAAERSKDTQK